MQSSPFSKGLVVIAFLLCVAGAAISGVLLQHHIVAQMGGDPLLGGVCNPTESASCDEVIASKWGKLEISFDKSPFNKLPFSARLGSYTVVIPTAALGVFFFASLGSWFLTVGVPTGKRRWLHILPTLATFVGLAACIWFEYLMFRKIGKFCPLCISTHVMTLILFVITLVLWRRPRATLPTIPTGQTVRESLFMPAPVHWPSWHVVVVAVVLAISSSALGWATYVSRLKSAYANQYFARWEETDALWKNTDARWKNADARWKDYDKDTRALYANYLNSPVVDIPIYEDDPILGPADSKFTVVVFSDFLCPMCKTLHAHLNKMREQFPGRFCIVYKHFPLDKECNTAISSTLHPGACAAAVASEAIRMLHGNDAFWQIHDAYFEAGRFTKDLALKQAEALGIDEETYMKRVHTSAVWDRIKRNVAEAKALGVKATPTIYFNNRRLAGWGDRHLWEYLLSEETLTAPAVTQPASQPALQPALQSTPAPNAVAPAMPTSPAATPITPAATSAPAAPAIKPAAVPEIEPPAANTATPAAVPAPATVPVSAPANSP